MAVLHDDWGVADTNVLVVGLIGGKGANREVLRRYFQGDLQSFVGNAFYIEYQDLPNRENMQTLCKQAFVSLMVLLQFASLLMREVYNWEGFKEPIVITQRN